MSLIPPNRLASAQHDIGMILLSELEKDDLETNIFMVSNLLNSSDTKDAMIAMINLISLYVFIITIIAPITPLNKRIRPNKHKP